MGASFFTFLDDIAVIMDDVAVASKVAAKNTAAILGDDLAVNAEKATGYKASRELPVLWAITKGSFLNKVIIVPLIILLNIYLPILIKILLVIGGVYLAYEGAEKFIEFLFHKKKDDDKADENIDIENDSANEKKKVNAAIKTDFILSLEIIIIALSSVLDKSLTIQIATVVIIASLATIGVYGLVAVLVRLDDFGYRLIKLSHGKGWLTSIGIGLVKALPIIVKALSVIGTIALILVSGGIFIHNIAWFSEFLAGTPFIIREAVFGLIVGVLSFGLVILLKSTLSKLRTHLIF